MHVLLALLLACLSVLWITEASADPSDVPAPSAATPAEDRAPEEPHSGTPARPEGAPSISLDSLLRPRLPRAPVGAPSEAERPGQGRPAADRELWLQRFAEARTEIEEREQRLQDALREASEASSGAYTYSPLGGGTTSDPESLKLRAQIRRDRKALEEAEEHLRDLQIEASLAGVPVEWTEPPEPDPGP